MKKEICENCKWWDRRCKRENYAKCKTFGYVCIGSDGSDCKAFKEYKTLTIIKK